jgi:hypothetical protein
MLKAMGEHNDFPCSDYVEGRVVQGWINRVLLSQSGSDKFMHGVGQFQVPAPLHIDTDTDTDK